MIEKTTLYVCDKYDTRSIICRECHRCGKFMQPAEFIRNHAVKTIEPTPRTRPVGWEYIQTFWRSRWTQKT